MSVDHAARRAMIIRVSDAIKARDEALEPDGRCLSYDETAETAIDALESAGGWPWSEPLTDGERVPTESVLGAIREARYMLYLITSYDLLRHCPHGQTEKAKGALEVLTAYLEQQR